MTNQVRELSTEVSKVVNEIAEKIPDGFEITLAIKKDSYRIELFDPSGKEVRVWTDYDTPGLDLQEYFEHAIELASDAERSDSQPTYEETFADMREGIENYIKNNAVEASAEVKP